MSNFNCLEENVLFLQRVLTQLNKEKQQTAKMKHPEKKILVSQGQRQQALGYKMSVLFLLIELLYGDLILLHLLLAINPDHH